MNQALDPDRAHVLFVCSGNICRSAAAERLTRAYLSAHGDRQLTVSSAGTRACVGRGVHPSTAQALERFGARVDDFAGRQVTRQLIESSTLVLTMTAAHRSAVLRLVPSALNRTVTLLAAEEALRSEPDPGPGASAADRLGLVARAVARQRGARALSGHPVSDIEDPVGLPADAHDETVTTIARSLLTVLPFVLGQVAHRQVGAGRPG